MSPAPVEPHDPGDATGDGSAGGDRPGLLAGRCAEGHLSYPPHPRCPTCGAARDGLLDLADRTATVVTWTTSTATPPGVRQPNHIAIVEFDVDGEPVRALGQLSTAEVAVGDPVRPVYVARLRDPEACVREADSQSWDGYRFEPAGRSPENRS